MAALTSQMAPGIGAVGLAHLGRSVGGHSTRGDGGALVFVFDTPEGTILFQDTSGHWSGVLERLAPDVAILAAAGRGNIDGEPIQGSLAEFVARQVSMLQPKRVVLGHHDDWLPGFSTATDMQPIRDAIGRASPDVVLLEPGYLASTEIFG
jgi:L-ascorbate metabolism protein UlaG (beta-lactamase superfamily)